MVEVPYAEAASVLRAARVAERLSDIEVMPGFEAMVAGAAVVLEIVVTATMRPVDADRWLGGDNPFSTALVEAVARAIAHHRNGDDVGEPLTRIVADVLCGGVLPVGEGDAVPWFAMGTDAGDLLRSSCDDVISVTREHIGALRGTNRYVDQRLADHADFGEPLFSALDELQLMRVDELVSGAEPAGAVELGVVAHSLVNPDDRGGNVRLARARVLSALSGQAVTAQHAAVRVDAERSSRRYAAGRGPAEPVTQTELFREIERAERVPLVTMVRLGLAVRRLEADRRIGRAPRYGWGGETIGDKAAPRRAASAPLFAVADRLFGGRDV